MWKQVFFEIVENSDGTFDLRTNDPNWKSYNVEKCRDAFEAMKKLSDELTEHWVHAHFYFE